MSDQPESEYHASLRELARSTLEDIDGILESTTSEQGTRMNTEQLGDFWLMLVEEATLRLIRLKPEMVTRVR